MYIRGRKRRTQKKKRQSRKTRRRRFSQAPNILVNISPVSSPGPNSPSFSLSPNTPKTPNTPITKRAKQLANLYPNKGTMVKRSTSFNEGITTEEFYNQFERLFPEKNGPVYQ